jgi:broad specificity phosphatase PhoE
LTRDAGKSLVPVGAETRRILLVRHGESTANVAAGVAERAGHEVIDVGARDADVELSELGRTQAATVRGALRAQLGDDWASTARVWSSPYLRAVQTARIATEGDGFRVDERLRDRELGIIDTLTSSGVDARLPDEAARRRWLGKFYYRPPGGESWADVALRIRSLLRDLEAAGSGPVVVFTHDAVVSLFVYVLLQLDEDRLTRFLADRIVGNASITSFATDVGGGWTLEAFGDASHVVGAGVRATEHTGTDNDGS